MSEWITDRRPSDDEWVLVDAGEGSVGPAYICRGKQVKDDEAWMPMPKPYQPPEPDTSLSASIERMDTKYLVEGRIDTMYSNSRMFDDDLIRILDAAKKLNNRGK